LMTTMYTTHPISVAGLVFKKRNKLSMAPILSWFKNQDNRRHFILCLTGAEDYAVHTKLAEAPLLQSSLVKNA